MEDATVFNAGNGAVFTAEGKNELDASIMNGDSLRAGAVGRVTTVKNTIRSSTRQRP
jgi:beta-aspartyl-peptidase (threonine type)